jgi:hypothetical protein
VGEVKLRIVLRQVTVTALNTNTRIACYLPDILSKNYDNSQQNASANNA